MAGGKFFGDLPSALGLGFAKGLLPGGAQDVSKGVGIAFFGQLLLELQRLDLDLLDHSGGDFRRSAGGHRQEGGDVVRLHRREEGEVDPAAPHQATGDQQQAEASGDEGVAPAQNDFQGRLVDPLHKPLQPPAESSLEALPDAPPSPGPGFAGPSVADPSMG